MLTVFVQHFCLFQGNPRDAIPPSQLSCLDERFDQLTLVELMELVEGMPERRLRLAEEFSGPPEGSNRLQAPFFSTEILRVLELGPSRIVRSHKPPCLRESMEGRRTIIVVFRLSVLLPALMVSRPLDLAPGFHVQSEVLIEVPELRHLL